MLKKTIIFSLQTALTQNNHHMPTVIQTEFGLLDPSGEVSKLLTGVLCRIVKR